MVSSKIFHLVACCTLTWPGVGPVAAQQVPSQAADPNGMAITIDDLAGPNGPGPAESKGHHWKVEPDYGWWGPGAGFGDGFDDGFDGFPY